MGYEASKFGDGSASGGGNVTTQVTNHFGQRDTGDTHGAAPSAGHLRQYVINLDGSMVSNEAFPLGALPPRLPAKIDIRNVWLDVTEVFVLGGSTPVVEVGTEGTEATNGVTLSESALENLGISDQTSNLAGTWAAPLQNATVVGIDLAGTSPTSTSAGKAKLVIEYVELT